MRAARPPGLRRGAGADPRPPWPPPSSADLYIFGIFFNLIAIFTYEYDAVFEKGFFHGYQGLTWLMVLNHALSGLAVSMVMKYANNIIKVYSTSVAMLITTVISIPLFGYEVSLPFLLGGVVVACAVTLNALAKTAK